MRKNIAIIYIMLLILGIMINYLPAKTEAAGLGQQMIPQEAIRLRILANSNSEADQALKRQIRDQVKKDIDQWIGNIDSLEEARTIIASHLSEIEETAQTEMNRMNIKQTIKVELGQTDFPTKLYGDYLYPAGKYEAVKISLGAAQGNNWWCVLYPPLCFLDFNSGTAVEKEDNQAEDITNEQAITESEVNNQETQEEQGQPEVQKEKNDQEVKVDFAVKKLLAKLF